MEKDKAILVIEDDVVTREMIKIIFVEQGYEVSTAFDGVDAVLRLTKRNFDLILCDIFMPSLNGFQLLEFLNRKKLSIPVIFLTASDKVEDEIKGLMLGAKDYIRKPINKSTMLIRAERVINNSADKIDQISLDHSTLVPEGEKKAKSLCYDS
ncbi:MAG TPA: response regulator [Syntrophales bacterium]|jgi:DNA-binding response OmpR family regulator|nr:response regulator [Syntrophales bacterium]HPI56158.1 response regulator [Syntrophales bacterium]HPN24346.1 response regulator [Syntrophales bacterium]HQM28976.1 response regulator [Syntrophales bacterium]